MLVYCVCLFIEINRLIKKSNVDKPWRFKAKERVMSTPSELQPPTGYQQWAVTLPTS